MGNRLAVAKAGRGGMSEFGISRCKLLYREFINNKILLYSSGNCIDYQTIMENNIKKNIYIYICIIESLCCIAETNTTW